MIKKFFTTVFFTLTMMNFINAQVSYGIRSGVNYATWKGDDIQIIEDLVDKTEGYIVTKGRTGLHIGGYVHIPISETFAFEPGFEYSKKGYSLKGDFQIPVLKYLGVNARAQVQSHYIDIPLVIKAKVYNGLHVYAGPQVSYLVRSTLNAKIGVLGITLFTGALALPSALIKLTLD